MKSIKLTEEHKSKLLEMCNKLFPEYNDILFSPITFDILMFNGTKKDTIYIHWFEFCTKIGYKIFSRKQFYYQSEKFITFMKIMCLQDKSKLKHPIDYLYEEFKKLKL